MTGAGGGNGTQGAGVSSYEAHAVSSANAANSDKSSLESWRRGLQKEQSKASPSAQVLATAALFRVPVDQRGTRILLLAIWEQSSAHIVTGANKIFLSRKCPNL